MAPVIPTSTQGGTGLHKGGLDRSVALALFGLALCLYLLTAAGYIVSEDGTQMFNTTRSIVREGEFSIPWGHAMEGRGGALFSRYGVMLSLAAVPAYALGWALSSFGPALARENPEFVERFAVSMVNPVIGALLLVVVFMLGRAVGYSRRTSVALALATGLCTFVWAGAKYFVSEPLQGLLLAAALLVSIRRGDPGDRSPALAGALLGMCFLTKPTTLVAYPAYAAILLWGRGGARPMGPAVRRLLVFSLPLAAAGLLSAGYNYYRFENPFEFGFGFQDPRNRAFSTPLARGLYGLLFSSGKSVFLYAPTAVLLVISVRTFFKRDRAAAFACALVPVVFVALYAKWVAWHGDGFWGPRYLLPVVPFLILPVGVLLEGPRRGARLRSIFFAATCAVGLLVQVGGVSVSYAGYFREVGAYPYTRPFYDPLFMHDVHFCPSCSPIVGHWRMLGGIVTGEKGWNKISLRGSVLESRVPVEEEAADAFRRGLDIWYVHFYRAGVPAGKFIWGPVALAAGAVLAGARLRALLRRE